MGLWYQISDIFSDLTLTQKLLALLVLVLLIAGFVKSRGKKG